MEEARKARKARWALDLGVRGSQTGGSFETLLESRLEPVLPRQTA